MAHQSSNTVVRRCRRLALVGCSVLFVTCTPPATNEGVAHPFRADTVAWEVRPYVDSGSSASAAVTVLCDGILQANAGWVVATVETMTEVYEADPGTDRADADPALYTFLRVESTIVGEHPESYVIRKVCGRWSPSRYLGCDPEYKVGDRIVAGIVTVEGTNAGFPVLAEFAIGVVQDESLVTFYRIYDTYTLADLTERIQRAYRALSPIVPVCDPGTDWMTLDHCPPDTLDETSLPRNVSSHRSNAWCSAEPYRPPSEEGVD
jgi:hypothetical protein